MSQNNQSIDALVSTSGTLASIGLAVVAIITAKTSMTHIQTYTDDIFLFSSLGFILVIVLGYFSQKNRGTPKAHYLVRVAEWIFSCSLLAIVVGAILMVYTSI